MNFKFWKNIDKIIKLIDFVVFARPGFKTIKMPGIRVITAINSLDISSTVIRQRIKNGLGVKKFLPDVIYNYIVRKKLYKSHIKK